MDEEQLTAIAALAGQVNACTRVINSMISVSTEVNALGRLLTIAREMAISESEQASDPLITAMYESQVAHLEQFITTLEEHCRRLQAASETGAVQLANPVLYPSEMPLLPPRAGKPSAP